MFYMLRNNKACARPTTPQSAYAASSTKARLRMPLSTTPQSACAASSPYTGEPIEVRTDQIQRHRPTPPLCKAPEAAVQRRCGDRLWRWMGCEKRHKTTSLYRYLQPLSHLTVPALPRHAYVCHRHYSGALTQGSL